MLALIAILASATCFAGGAAGLPDVTFGQVDADIAGSKDAMPIVVRVREGYDFTAIIIDGDCSCIIRDVDTISFSSIPDTYLRCTVSPKKHVRPNFRVIISEV